LNPDDFEESFCRSSGPGGQNVNKVSTAVELRHRPSGIAVTVQDSRYQAMNRRLAGLRILERFTRMREEQQQARTAARAKKRRQRVRRTRAGKNEMLAGKRHRSEIKKGRAAPKD